MIDPERYPTPEEWRAFLEEGRKPNEKECLRWGIKYPARKGWQSKMESNVHLAHNALPHLRALSRTARSMSENS